MFFLIGIGDPGSLSRKRWILGAAHIQLFSAIANALRSVRGSKVEGTSDYFFRLEPFWVPIISSSRYGHAQLCSLHIISFSAHM